jgi:hypothetical protein
MKARSPRAEKTLLLLAGLFIACASTASYFAGLHAAKCRIAGA